MQESTLTMEDGFRLLMAAETAHDKRRVADLVESAYPELVRVGAVNSLADNFADRALPELLAALDSKSERVRAAAARRLFLRGDYESAIGLIAHINDVSDDVACWCVGALPHIGGRTAVEQAAAAFARGGRNTRARAVDVLLVS